MARTIQSPGVEIKEIDLSLRPQLPIGTTVFATGFSPQGPTDEVLQVSSLSEFEQIYGKPSNAAERYFYHTVRGVFQSPANVLVSRLPYGTGAGNNVSDNYSALIYPVVAVSGTSDVVASVKQKTTITPVGFQSGLIPTGATWSITIDGDEFKLVEGVDIHEGSSSNAEAIEDWATKINASEGCPAIATFTNTELFLDAKVAGTGFTVVSGKNELADNEAISIVESVANYSQFHDADETISGLTAGTRDYSLSTADAYFIGEPTLIDLTESQYLNITNQQFTWSDSASDCAKALKTPATELNSYDHIGKSAIIVLNNKKFAINEKFEGYYVGLTDNTNLNPATDFDGILKIESLNKKVKAPQTAGGYVQIPDGRLAFPLSAASFRGKEHSVSEQMENASIFDLNGDEFSDTISLGLFKIRQSTLDPDTNKLDYILTETYTGSLNFFRTQNKQSGGSATSFFLESETEGTPNFKILVNPYISKHGGDWLDNDGNPTKKVRMITNKESTDENAYLNDIEKLQLEPSVKVIKDGGVNAETSEKLYPHGLFKETSVLANNLGTIPGKLDRVFELVDNHELFPIDITVDAGLSTIYAASEGGTTNFDDEEFLDISTDTVNFVSGGLFSTSLDLKGENPRRQKVVNIRDNFRTITKRFVDFAQNKRKDNIFISDPLRNVFVQGQGNKVLDDKAKNFSQHVYWPLKHLYASDNTSYAATYANWAKIYDDTLNKQIWTPMSGRIAAMYANTDSNFYPWIAPAGFTRGVLTTVNDLALYPKQKHRDQLYKIKMNPIANFPNDGFVVFGQKTLQTKPSAFDRVNVRRLFLYLEKATRATVKYFVFEPNTLFTRTQVINVLTPIFENAKNTQGLYDYLIICDERNNTPDVIDQNELVVDIYLKPVRAAEFILVNFYATRTGQDFSELVS
jgi:hypothetical protein